MPGLPETSCLPKTATRGNKRRNYSPAGMGQQDTEAEAGRVRIVLTVLSMLLRYVSEWDPRLSSHTRGGYHTGRISGVPDTATKMVLSYVPDKYQPGMEAHPLLLHVVRISNNKGSRALGRKTNVNYCDLRVYLSIN